MKKQLMTGILLTCLSAQVMGSNLEKSKAKFIVSQELLKRKSYQEKQETANKIQSGAIKVAAGSVAGSLVTTAVAAIDDISSDKRKKNIYYLFKEQFSDYLSYGYGNVFRSNKFKNEIKELKEGLRSEISDTSTSKEERNYFKRFLTYLRINDLAHFGFIGSAITGIGTAAYKYFLEENTFTQSVIEAVIAFVNPKQMADGTLDTHYMSEEGLKAFLRMDPQTASYVMKESPLLAKRNDDIFEASLSYLNLDNDDIISSLIQEGNRDQLITSLLELRPELLVSEVQAGKKNPFLEAVKAKKVEMLKSLIKIAPEQSNNINETGISTLDYIRDALENDEIETSSALTYLKVYFAMFPEIAEAFDNKTINIDKAIDLFNQSMFEKYSQKS